MRPKIRGRLGVAVLMSSLLTAPLAAQQAVETARPVAAESVRVAVPLPETVGPLRPPEWQRYQPELMPSRDGALPPEGSSHTFRLTTLEIVLIIVIVLLLVVR